MADIVTLAREHTDLAPEEVERLRALVADWGLLADLSFADLVLWLPTWNGGGFVAAAQQRPDTGRTLFVDDVVGTFVARGRRPVLDRTLASGRPDSDPDQRPGVEHRVQPLIQGGRVIALLSRYSASGGAESGRLDSAYAAAAEDLLDMTMRGTFPPVGAPAGPLRVGGGLLRLDDRGVVQFASPNAVSAFRRLGLSVDIEGASLVQLAPRLLGPGGTDGDLVRIASGQWAGSVELEHSDATVAMQSLPLTRDGRAAGALVLVRDVTDVRRRERALVTKDATLREVHHRIKNNLQMVAALLRMQSRRLDSGEAKAALADAGHRIGAIALVHEALSVSPEGEVDFDGVCDRILAMVSELVPLARVHREGRIGRVASDLATPLAMSLTELVANAAQHAGAGNEVRVNLRLRRGDDRLQLTVEDDGPGLPPGFDAEEHGRLGVGIVLALVSEVSGTVSWSSRSGGGTRAEIHVPA